MQSIFRLYFYYALKKSTVINIKYLLSIGQSHLSYDCKLLFSISLSELTTFLLSVIFANLKAIVTQLRDDVYRLFLLEFSN